MSADRPTTTIPEEDSDDLLIVNTINADNLREALETRLREIAHKEMHGLKDCRLAAGQPELERELEEVLLKETV